MRECLGSREIRGMQKMKQTDVLWLVEHVARELDVACAVKCIAKKKYGLTIEIKQVYRDACNLMCQRRLRPRVIALPFFFRSSVTAVCNYLKRWPNAIFFNLAWEQIFYRKLRQIKTPADDFVRQNVIHHAWGRFFKEYLVEKGVAERNIVLNGNPVYQLYLGPYRRYYRDRTWLAHRYGLDERKRWIFIPENYRWAFVKDRWMKELFKRGGGELDELLDMRRFAAASLTELLKWCNETAGNHELEIVFRPKPATMLKEMKDFFAERVNDRTPAHLHFIKGASVREWILASDLVISCFSTTLIEASIANRPVFMVEPLPLIDSFHSEWYKYLSRIKSGGEFERACTNELPGANKELGRWASRVMLSDGDPIAGLAEALSHLAGKSLQRPDLRSEMTAVIERLKQLTRRVLGRDQDYFNVRTNENDVFNDEVVNWRTRKWSEVLFHNPA